MSLFYYGFATTQAGITNVETVLEAPQHLEAGRIPLAGPDKELSLDNFAVRSGKINVPLRFDAPLDTQRISLNVFLFGDQTTQSKELYASAVDEFGFYSPYLVVVHRPYEQQDYGITTSDYLRAVILPCFNWRIQVATKTANYTVTTADRYLKADTTSGSVTFTLPTLASTVADTVYSFHKTNAANSMILDGNGAETIDGSATKTLTANGSRIDIAKIDGAWKTVRSGSMV